MSRVIAIVCGVMLPWFSALAGIGEVREWVSNDGRSLKGKLLEVSAEKIVVDRGGKRLEIPVKFLSRADQEYVAELAAAQEEAKAVEGVEAARLVGFKEGKYAEAVKDEWVKFDKSEHGLVYQLYIGRAATRKKAGPLVPLFVHLHGAGGRADDVEVGKVEIAAGCLSKEAQYEDTPCVICVPLCPPEPETWGKQTAKLEAIVDDLVANLPIDRSRIYLSGYSQGAGGIASMITSRPTHYAGAMFADGRPRENWVGKIETSLWFYMSGERDSSKFSKIQEGFAADGVEMKFDVFGDVAHNGIHWKMANEPKVFEWLFQQKLGEMPEPAN